MLWTKEPKSGRRIAMRALRVVKFGDMGEALQVTEVVTPRPGPGEVLVSVAAASINPSDVKNAQGRFDQTTLPRIPGRDLAGVVVEGDDEMKGRGVWATGGDIGFTRDGAHAEFIVLPKESIRPKPSRLSMVEAATVGTNYLTAYVGLMEKAQVKAGETVLVIGVSGGVGSSVAKLARCAHARVIGVDREAPDEKTSSSLGLALALGSESDDVTAMVREFTDGRGADIAFDCVGGPLFEMALDALARNGRQVNITATGERRASFDLLSFYRRQLTLFGVNTAEWDVTASAEILDRLRPLFESGDLTPPPIARTCTLDEAIEAYEQVSAGSAGGKIVITF
jgi:NADPH:quinone reductase-like Zn-dependent oxidoreductase